MTSGEQTGGVRETGAEQKQSGLRFGLLTLDELEALVNEKPSSFVVERLIPQASIVLAVGDSGLGKTPWAYQVGLAVAGNKPFLGHETKRGTVVYIDLENGVIAIVELVRRLSEHLGLTRRPDNFFVLPAGGEIEIEKIVECYQPSLVIVDSLRACWPDAESKNENAATVLSSLRRLARKYGTSFLLLHHIKKPSQQTGAKQPSLEHDPVLAWLLSAAGARALVNQSDVRIGFDAPAKRGTGDSEDDVVLLMRLHTRLQGESDPVFLARSRDVDGEVTGYRRVGAIAMLNDDNQRRAFHELPSEFTFTDARRALGRAPDPTNKFLRKCTALGLVKKTAHGRYQKTTEGK